MGNRDAVELHVMPLGDVGCYKQNRNTNFIFMHPVGPFSSLVIHLLVGVSDLLEGCCLSCLIGSRPFHLRPHLVHLAKPFVCIHLHDVLLFWSVPRTLYFHLTFLVLFSFPCFPSILFLFARASGVYCSHCCRHCKFVHHYKLISF